jgi:hypothetical protein
MHLGSPDAWTGWHRCVAAGSRGQRVVARSPRTRWLVGHPREQHFTPTCPGSSRVAGLRERAGRDPMTNAPPAPSAPSPSAVPRQCRDRSVRHGSASRRPVREPRPRRRQAGDHAQRASVAAPAALPDPARRCVNGELASSAGGHARIRRQVSIPRRALPQPPGVAGSPPRPMPAAAQYDQLARQSSSPGRLAIADDSVRTSERVAVPRRS